MEPGLRQAALKSLRPCSSERRSPWAGDLPSRLVFGFTGQALAFGLLQYISRAAETMGTPRRPGFTGSRGRSTCSRGSTSVNPRARPDCCVRRGGLALTREGRSGPSARSLPRLAGVSQSFAPPGVVLVIIGRPLRATIRRVKIPNAARAIVDIEKLRDYCLNPEHPRGRHKARVFARRLGLYVRDAPAPARPSWWRSGARKQAGGQPMSTVPATC